MSGERTSPRQIIADEIINLVHERWVGMKHHAYLERIEACRFVVEAQLDKVAKADATEMEQRAIKAERALGMADQGYTAMRDALVLVLPLAKGYAAIHPHDSNLRYCQIATDLLEGKA